MSKSRRVDVLLVVSTALAFIVVAFFSRLETALASAVSFGVFASILSLKWESRRNPVFVVTFLGLALVHIILLASITVPDLRVGIVSVPVALADGFAMWALLNWVERRFS